jgi:hypothetical protein
MRNAFLTALAAGGLLVGCGGEPEAPLVAPAPQAQSLDITQPAAPAVTAPESVAPPAAAAATELTDSEPLGGKGRPLTEQEVMLINYGVSMFKEEKGRFPATLQEAVTTRHITRLPQLPTGEKFVYDATTGSVKVEMTN